jgi:hypothetical protein
MAFRQELKRLAQSWPKDPFRPNMQLPVFLDSLVDHPKLTPQAVKFVKDLKDDVLKNKVSLILILRSRNLLNICL